ncbi:immunity 22 family protein [Zobellia galactanivorans]|uniref:immunity 22 family protein n=1 Tax=Zobellia galactanivorans (strain DSM 12802 / CCUG 47099 / CIP 106680 / NCIMB 13871 / Dsij) TaxID=63186 RepID=UPI001C0776EA|nr:immunity 22 family protein [Zobellia galactanivorans]MBU3024760.1 immunity 22 family protein [Zobellia galactanivorans]
MEAQNKVSVFVGNFSSEEDFKKFIKESFTEDGDISSELMNELKVDFIDSQFQEIYFSENGISKDILNNFSYSENFISYIKRDLLEYNSIIFLYNFQFKKPQNLSKIELLGVFDYR